MKPLKSDSPTYL